MLIELDELLECTKCGTVFNYKINGVARDDVTSYPISKIYEGKCPICKKKWQVL